MIKNALPNAIDRINGFLKVRINYQLVVENSGNGVYGKIINGVTTIFAVRGTSISDVITKLAKVIDER
jgi:hypothetical protein